MPVGELDYFFEGTEKLLELWFTSSQIEKKKNENRLRSLRLLTRNEVDSFLGHVNCSIISKLSNDAMDAYVLSESSLFVTNDRLILKTCGTTTLLHAINPIIRLAEERCGFDIVRALFFSRKSFVKPEKQIAPHTSFDEESAWLDRYFEGGASYSFGNRKTDDQWHLYSITPYQTPSCNNNQLSIVEPDQTMELLMTDLDPEVMKIFYQSYSRDGLHARELAGIDQILPESQIDDFLFEPCGYSANGLLMEGQYWTIHITPETEFAYVSFETNVARKDYHSLIRKVMSVFRPGKAVLTFLSNESSISHETHAILRGDKDIDRYHQTEYQFSILKNYYLTYSLYKTAYS